MNYKFKQLNMKEHRRCPNCPRLMIKRMSNEIDGWATNRPVKEWHWFCNCGQREKGGKVRGIPELEWYKKEWERVNNITRCPESNTVDMEE